MKTLNNKSKQIFCALIDRMKGEYMKIYVEGFMPLTIEKIGEGIGTPFGMGSLFSLCHYYKQNGDLMQDPEMGFVVIDERGNDHTAWENVVIIPYMLQQASQGIYEESVLFQNGRMTRFNRKMQAGHTAFANQWLRNIKAQRFLK